MTSDIESHGRGGTVRTMPIPKISTGIRGLDQILNGGLPRGRVCLLSGGPGTGKTVLALELLCRAAAAGRPGLLVSFEERTEDIRLNARSMGLDLGTWEQLGLIKCARPARPQRPVKAGDFDLRGLLAILDGYLREIKAECVVLDALDMLMTEFRDPDREREEWLLLDDWLRERGVTALLTTKAAEDGSRRYPFLDFMADCVLLLDQRIVGQVRTRRLNVVKYRGSPFLANEHPYVITSKGLAFLPVSSMSLDQPISEERVSSGNRVLDRLLEGGLHQGSSILLAGASGTGKTSLAAAFAHAACSRDERVLFVGFEQSPAALLAAMRGIGLDLAPAVAAGRLRIIGSLPETAGTELHLVYILDAITEHAPRHVIVDAISATRRMGSEQAAFDFLVRLLCLCRERAITCLCTHQLQEETIFPRVHSAGIASLLDALIALEFTVEGRRLHRRLLINKFRASGHSLGYHRFEITAHGVELEEPAEGPDPLGEGGPAV